MKNKKKPLLIVFSILLIAFTFIALLLLRREKPQPLTQAQFELDMRQHISERGIKNHAETVGIRGDYPPLSWGKTSIASDENKDGIYEITIPFELTADSQTVSFKIKIEGGNQPDEGWQKGRNHTVTIHRGQKTQVKLAWEDEPPPPPKTLTGQIDIIPNFQGDSLAPRPLFVYLPPGYAANKERRYPVLYMQDGQALFDASHIGQEWEMDETAERLISQKEIEPIIIVGIGNTPNRIDEYTPTSQFLEGVKGATGDDEKEVGGKGEAYADFLIHRVKPYIDENYRTYPQKEWTALGGSSLGGLITLTIGLEHPDVFSELLAVSPSVWWDNKYIVHKVERLPQATHQRIWLDIGSMEGENAVKNVNLLYDKLLEKGWKKTELKLTVAEGALHNERAWAKRVPDMLRFLFPDK